MDCSEGGNVVEERSICFVSCVNDEELYAQCLAHVHALTVPEGWSVATLPLRGCRSMTACYNQALRDSQAKYKVYLHQDVLIVDPKFLTKALSLFGSYPDLGLIGIVGARTLPASGIWWESGEKFGKVLARWPGEQLLDFGDPGGDFASVAALDGQVLMTQCDITWDERLEGFHFYDTSQCLRFRQHGYKVGVVPSGPRHMVIHACGPEFDRAAYERTRKTFLELYAADLNGPWPTA